MIQFTVNGDPLVIPSRWEDLTFDQYVEYMQMKGGAVETISLFTGIDVETLSKATISGLESVLMALSFLNTMPVMPGIVNKVGKYELPLNSKGEFDIRFESLGQFEDMRRIISANPDGDTTEHTKSYKKYVAIYLQKIREGEYDYDKAIKMQEEVGKMPAIEVITAGSFFFLKLLSLLTGTHLNSQPTPQSQKKKLPVSRSSKKSSGRTPRSRKSR